MVAVDLFFPVCAEFSKLVMIRMLVFMTNTISEQVPLDLDWLQDNSISGDQMTEARQNRVLVLAREILQLRHQVGTIIQSPLDSAEYLLHELREEEREIFGVLFLSQKHEVIEFARLFSGTIAEASVYPREIVKYAMNTNAAAVILTHNHPSGDPSPSEADIQITQRVEEALKLVSVSVLDHIVVGGCDWVSLKDKGLF